MDRGRRPGALTDALGLGIGAGLSKLFPAAGNALSKLQINQKHGDLAEDMVKWLMKGTGFDVIAAGRRSTQAVAKTAGPGGGPRYLDILARTPISRKLIAIEVKSGGSKYLPRQQIRDQIMENTGATLTKNARDLIGQVVQAPTTVIRVPRGVTWLFLGY